MKIFIAGIGGTFMGGIAQLANAGGHQVRGCDANLYPPMSELLQAQNIEVARGYLPAHLGDPPGTVLIGNALARGNPMVEHILNRALPFQSGAEWLREQVLKNRSVIAVAGTHGKTTVTSMLAWILTCHRQSPGYLIGGKPGNFAGSAELGDGKYFVIEADEYDTAFFDKRSKFVHYRPHIAVLNNLEFDHADIFADTAQIMQQFHHLLRTVPGNGYVVVNADDARLTQVLAMGCWSQVVRFSIAEDSAAAKASPVAEWRALPHDAACSRFAVFHHQQLTAQVEWQCIGRHNMQNALAAVAAAELAGVPAARAGQFLRDYQPVERRLQLLFESEQARVYDDFAHHPTAIRHTIDAVRAKHADSYVIAVVELRSNSMKMGAHGEALTHALAAADWAIVAPGGNLEKTPGMRRRRNIVQLQQASEIISTIRLKLTGNDVIITMSNGSFDGLPKRIANFFAELKK